MRGLAREQIATSCSRLTSLGLRGICRNAEAAPGAPRSRARAEGCPDDRIDEQHLVWSAACLARHTYDWNHDPLHDFEAGLTHGLLGEDRPGTRGNGDWLAQLLDGPRNVGKLPLTTDAAAGRRRVPGAVGLVWSAVCERQPFGRRPPCDDDLDVSGFASDRVARSASSRLHDVHRELVEIASVETRYQVWRRSGRRRMPGMFESC